MLYCNCHYRYKDQICQLMELLSNSFPSSQKARVCLLDGTEVVCLQSDLKEIPLTETVLQVCYKSKIYIRNGKWDLIWSLDSKNDINVGEKLGKFFLIQSDQLETVVDLLPFELVQGFNINDFNDPRPLKYVSDLELLNVRIDNYSRLNRVIE